MLTFDELVNEVTRLGLRERLSLLEVLAKSVKDEVIPSLVLKQTRELEERQNLSIPGKKIPVEQIYGMLKPDGPMLSDQEVEDIRYQSLAEKYHL
jgi:hypothetical protein